MTITFGDQLKQYETVFAATDALKGATVLLADGVLVLREGRISVDLAVDLPRPPRIGGQPFDELRDRLLAEPGVHREAADSFG